LSFKLRLLALQAINSIAVAIGFGNLRQVQQAYQTS
jgi:hypothetical protein